ncbi:MAG: hypothetical protein IJC15_09480, partial [Clostridia bacterium]|nr:hypothetical protein [Clostridia bacterium]
NYYQHDGLQENEFNAKAAYKAIDGKLYFGGIKGLTAFYPHIVDQTDAELSHFCDAPGGEVPVYADRADLLRAGGGVV